MNKGHKATARARSRLFVDQPRAFFFHLRKRGVNVVHAHRDMMNSRPTLIEKLGDRRAGRSWLKQLDAGFAKRQHRYADLLFRDLFNCAQIQTERLTPPRRRFINAICRNADVIDLHFVGAGLVPARTFDENCARAGTSPAPTFLESIHRPPNTDLDSCLQLPPPGGLVSLTPSSHSALSSANARAITRGFANAQLPAGGGRPPQFSFEPRDIDRSPMPALRCPCSQSRRS